MKNLRFLGVLAAGFLSSAIVTACSGEESSASADPGTGGSSSSSSGSAGTTVSSSAGSTTAAGSGGSGGGAGCGCEVKKPEMATEFCSHTFEDPGFGTTYYAEHVYPGSTMAELAGVVAVRSIDMIGHLPPEYTLTAGSASAAQAVIIGDGKVAVRCMGQSPATTSVIFVKP